MVNDYPKSLMELERRFSNEEACRHYLFGLRWPEGFVCPRCAGTTARPMCRGLWLCGTCGHQVSVAAGTIFQASHLPLTAWFRAMWHVSTRKNGISATELQRVLGLGSYETAWTVLHRLRRAMASPGQDRLRGLVDVHETYLGGEQDLDYWPTDEDACMMVAVEEDGKSVGRIRLRSVLDFAETSLRSFIAESIDLGSTVRTNGPHTFLNMDGYGHDGQIQCRLLDDTHFRLRLHRIMLRLERWLRVTHRGAIGHEYLNQYLDEFTFRFNLRKSRNKGEVFYRLARQAVQTELAASVHVEGSRLHPERQLGSQRASEPAVDAGCPHGLGGELIGTHMDDTSQSEGRPPKYVVDVFDFDAKEPWQEVLAVVDHPLAIRALNAGMAALCHDTGDTGMVWNPNRGPWSYSVQTGRRWERFTREPPEPNTPDWYRVNGYAHAISPWAAAVGSLLYPEHEWIVAYINNALGIRSHSAGIGMKDHTKDGSVPSVIIMDVLMGKWAIYKGRQRSLLKKLMWRFSYSYPFQTAIEMLEGGRQIHLEKR